MPAPLTSSIWSEIRRHWEFDPDSPSFHEAAARAASACGFKAPVRSAVHRKAQRQGWERRGSMDGVVEASHARADAVATSEDAVSGKKSHEVNARMAAASRDEAVTVRAEVLARHRAAWGLINDLRGEALALRHDDPATAFDKAKLAKISAETLAIQQTGERKAWGLDALDPPPDFSRLSDEQLARLAAGKPI